MDLKNCTIGLAHADDGLNVKRADFTIRQCVFRGNASDAFDGDWVRGTIDNCVFRDNGGDAIDLSGSDVRITDCLLARSGDKGLSVGEKSTVTGFNNIIRECATGVAAKDLSKVSIYASALCANETALSVYQKKQVFGPAAATAIGTLFWKNRRDLSVDTGSRLEVRGIGVETWQPPPGVIADDVRQGPLARYYHEYENGHVQYNHLAAESPFAHGPHTNGTAEGGLIIPDLFRTPIGLARPLEVPDDFCPEIRTQIPTDSFDLLQSTSRPQALCPALLVFRVGPGPPLLHTKPLLRHL